MTTDKKPRDNNYQHPAPLYLRHTPSEYRDAYGYTGRAEHKSAKKHHPDCIPERAKR